MKCNLFLLLIACSGCSLLEQNSEFTFTPEDLNGEWIRTSYENQFKLYRLDDSHTQEDIQNISYSFVNNSYSSCTITHSDKPRNYYYNCRWFLHGEEYPNLFMSLEYNVQDNPNNETFRLLYKIRSTTDQSITLRTIRQSF